MKKFIVLFLLISQAALADGYSKFYTGYPGVTSEQIAKQRTSPPPEKPELRRYSDSPEKIYEAFARKGYSPIGYSSFTSGWTANDKGALKQGMKLRADIVVVMDPSFSESVTTSMPLVTPSTSTTYINGTANVFGSGGNATVYGSGTATTYGSKTTYIPITTNRYEYGAIYFFKSKARLGVYQRALNDEERGKLQSNSGVVVTLVIDDSPAFINDILAGDIILRMNDQVVSGSEKFFELLELFSGTQVEIALLRDGSEIKKKVMLNK